MLLTLLACQAIWPKRQFALKWHQRWSGALALIVIGSVLSRLVLPAGLVGIAVLAGSLEIGAFNMLGVPLWADIVIGFIALDFAIWLQHVAMHRVPLLWRMHRVHHTDPGLDVTTALRFHPFEFLVSLVWKMLIVLTLGASPLTVAIFVITLNCASMFNHTNLAIPASADRWLRWIIVTPDMHRIHHSTDHAEANTNFGFCLPWWDHLFSTYTASPAQGHLQMELGDKSWRDAKSQTPWALLRQPFD